MEAQSNVQAPAVTSPPVMDSMPSVATGKEVSTGFNKPQGAAEGLSASDLVIPRIHLMQALSKLVSAKKAQVGEFRASLDGTLLGDEKTPLELIPIMAFKTWVISEKKPGQSKYEYVKTEPWSPENDGWSYEETINGVSIMRQRSLNYYVITTADVKAGTPFPAVVAFRSTSHSAGKKLATLIIKLAAFNKSSMDRVFSLSAVQTSNEKGTYYVMDVAQGRATTDDEKTAAKEAYDFIRTANVKVDDSVDSAEAEVGGATDPQPAFTPTRQF